MNDRADSSDPSSEPQVPSDTLLQGLESYAVITLDTSGKILEWSTGAEAIFGYAPSEIIGQPFGVLFTPEDQAANRPAQELSRASGGDTSEDQRWHVRKDGTRIWISGTVRAASNENGELTGFVKIAREITSYKLAELQREALLLREQQARVQAEQRWRHLEEISENIPAMIGLVRLPEQVYVFANRKFRELMGDRQLIGRTPREAHPEVQDEYFQLFDTVAETGRAYSATERMVGFQAGANLQERYFDFVFQPMRSEAGQYEAIIIFAVDVSERVRARQALEQLTRELETERDRLKVEAAERQRVEALAGERAATVAEQASMLDLAEDAIFSVSLEGAIEFWNRGAEQMYGWSKQEAQGRNVHELLQTEFPVPVMEIYNALLTEGRWAGELKHRSRSGQEVEVWTVWVLRKDGSTHGWLEIARDVTERKRFEARLLERQKLESIGILAGGIAHDFNNLLTGIVGNISLTLEMIQPSSPLRDLLVAASNASDKAALLVKQMLAYAGKGQFFAKAVDLSSVVRNAMRLVRIQVPSNVKVRLALAKDLPVIQADETQLEQLVTNLVLNAVEAIGDAPGEIEIRTGIQDVQSPGTLHDFGQPAPGRSVVLEVKDTGSGIDPSILPKIFDPFFTTKFMGRGLGLAAVSGIVRTLKGAVKVDTTPASGTTMRVLLPAEVTPQEEGLPAEESHAPILVVDDEETVRHTAEAILRHRGFQVILATGGEQAVELFRKRQGRIALVLLDMSMPGMGGEETLPRLKMISSNVPVIVSSGYDEQEAARRFGGLDVAGFIQKPYTARTLIEKIGSVLKLQQRL